MKRIFLVPLLLVSAATAQTAAPAKQNVKFSLSQDLVKAAVVDGKTVETIVENPKTVLPDDILREEVALQNTSGKVIPGLTVSVPVPKGTEFSGSVTPNAERWKVQYSVDGGKTYSATPQQTVTVTENGKAVSKQVNVPANKYTNVRWVVTALKPDETLKLSFRVKVK